MLRENEIDAAIREHAPGDLLRGGVGSPHLSIADAHRGGRVTQPDPSLLDDVVASKVLAAMMHAERT